jgi:hypothetical protein
MQAREALRKIYFVNVHASTVKSLCASRTRRATACDQWVTEVNLRTELGTGRNSEGSEC